MVALTVFHRSTQAVEMCCAARACFFLREVHYFGEDPRILLRFEAGRKTPRVFATLVERYDSCYVGTSTYVTLRTR